MTPSSEPVTVAAPLPLHGIRVLDFTGSLSGPYCTMSLGDLGADVVKVERPKRGDDARHWGPPFLDGTAAYFFAVNRNKRSVVLDLASRGGVQAARDLAEMSDIVVENWRPGVADRLGVGADDLRARRSDLVYCSISGFGADAGAQAGYDQVVQGMSGLQSLTGRPEDPPTKIGVSITDIAAGMFAAQAILAALYERERTGSGRTIDVAMHDAALALLVDLAVHHSVSGETPRRNGNRHATIVPYATFETEDGYVNVCVGNDVQWDRLCDALDDQSLQDPAFATNGGRLDHSAELYPRLADLFMTTATEQLLATLDNAGVPCGPVRELHDTLADPAVVARGSLVTLAAPGGREVRAIGAPWRLDGCSSPVRLPPPGLGEHTRPVLLQIGYASDHIASLIEGPGQP